MLAAARSWAERARRASPSVRRIVCFGSYARGDYIPSSDLDLFVEVESSALPRMIDRADELPSLDGMPVAVDLFVYTSDEIAAMRDRNARWLETVEREGIAL